MESLGASVPLTEDDLPQRPLESQTPAAAAMTDSIVPPAAQTLERNPVVEAKTLAESAAVEGGLGLESPPRGLRGKTPFAGGDFVWGKKAKSHPWWPGLVCDPASAPVRAKNTHKTDEATVPVAWFGDGGSCSWCEPSRLKPFVPEFNEMVRRNSSKGFVRAVEEALDEVRRCLELELSCHCVPPEARAKSFEGRVLAPPIENFQCLEFLLRLHDVACNGTEVSLMEIAMLKSWAVAFGKGWTNGAPGYHLRRGLSELVDKIDLDVSPGYLGDSGDNVDELPEMDWIDGGMKREMKISEDRLYKRKRKSINKLISEMDLDTVELSEDEEIKVVNRSSRKRKVRPENVIEFDAESGCAKVEEYSGSGRRERKKSKYLSPPYTDVVDKIKSLISPKSVDKKMSKESSEASQTMNTESPVVLKQNNKKKEDKASPLLKIKSIFVNELLSDLLYAAITPFHLKGNRSGKTVRAFFGSYRSSMYASGSGFLEYQNHHCESSCKKLKTVGEVMVVSSNVGTAERKGENEDNREGKEKLGGSNSDPGSRTVTNKPRRKRKAKNEVNFEGAAKLEHHSVNIPVENKCAQNNVSNKGMANGESIIFRSEPIGCQQPAEMKHGVTSKSKSKMSSSGENVVLLGHCARKISQEGGSGKKKKTDKVLSSLFPSSSSKITSGLEEKSKQKQEDGCDYRYPAALLLTFSTDTTLPSKDELVSAFSKYGVIIEPETELLKEKSCARVVFAKSTDAEKAFNSSDKTGIFKSDTSYHLQYLPPIASPPPAIRSTKPGLPYIRENLERMISTLTSSSSHLKESGALGAMKSDARENLVCDMEGLLKKVNTMLNGPAAGAPS